MEKLKRYAGNIDKALAVIRRILIVITVAASGAMVFGIIFARPIEDGASRLFETLSFSGGIFTVWVKDAVLNAWDLRLVLGSAVLLMAVFAAITLYAIKVLQGMMGEMKEGRPFTPEMPGRIRKLAYTMFVYAVAMPFFTSIPAWMVFRIPGIRQALTELPMIDRVNINFGAGIDVILVLAGFMVLLLSLVFEYGAQLQRQQDETL
jgi:hypothetical protein